MIDPIRVFLVDDHQVVREGLKLFLDLQERIEVIGEAENGDELFSVLRRIQPDLILLDMLLTGSMGGVEITERLKDLYPSIKIVILSSSEEEKLVLPALEAGADSYLLKNTSPSKLSQSIVKTMEGESCLSPAIAKLLLGRIKIKSSSCDELSRREKEVLNLIGQGMGNEQIGKELFISPKTVKGHVSKILAKLDLKDRTQIAVYAWKNGLMDL